MPRFSEIKPFISTGSYEVNVAIKRVEHLLKEFEEDYGLALTPDFETTGMDNRTAD